MAAVGLGVHLALERGGPAYPVLRLHAGRRTLSVQTGACSAPDENGAIAGAANCMRRTASFDPRPAAVLTATPGQALRIGSTGTFRYALLRIDHPPCGGVHRLRVTAARPVWVVPRRGPATYSVRLTFDRSHGVTPTVVFGVRAGSPQPDRASICPV